jgi:hypothetical protein
MGVTFAEPSAALVALFGLVPVALALHKLRASRALRRELDLAPPSRWTSLGRPLALLWLFGLLGLAAAGPSIQQQREQRSRADAEVVVAIDNSRSMLASETLNGPRRFERALAFAQQLHDALPEVPIGVSSLTNRLLPYLFPTTDRHDFALVLAQAYGIESPPPSLAYATLPGTSGAHAAKWVTSFQPINQAATQAFFRPTARKRVLVVLSDAETQDFASRRVLSHLRDAHVSPIVVRFWKPDERIFRLDGGTEPYVPTQSGELGVLHRAGWAAVEEGHVAPVVERIRQALGSGPIERVGFGRTRQPFAPALVVAAFAPLLLLLVPAGRLPRIAKRRSARSFLTLNRLSG